GGVKIRSREVRYRSRQEMIRSAWIEGRSGLGEIRRAGGLGRCYCRESKTRSTLAARLPSAVSWLVRSLRACAERVPSATISVELLHWLSQALFSVAWQAC